MVIIERQKYRQYHGHNRNDKRTDNSMVILKMQKKNRQYHGHNRKDKRTDNTMVILEKTK